MDRQEHASNIRSKGYPCIYFIKAFFEILHKAFPSFQTSCWKLKINLHAYRYGRIVSNINLKA